MGHLILNAAFFAQARTKVRQSWWRYGRLAQIWKQLESFVNEHDQHPRSASELKDFGPWTRQSLEDLKSANEAVDRCLYRAHHEYSLEALKAELDVWMQANIIESSMTKVQTSYTTVTKTGKKSDMDQVKTILRLMLRDLDEATFLGNGTADMSNLGQALLDERADYDTALTFGCPAVDNLLLPDGPDGRSLVRGDHTVILSPTNQGKSTALITVSSANLLQGKDVLFIFHEGRINDIRTKFLKCLLGAGYQETLTRLSTPEAALIQQTVNEHLVVLPIIQGGITVEEVMGHIERAQDEWYAKTGRHFDLIVDDYPGKLMTMYAKGGQMAMRHIQEIAYNRFTDLAQATGRECHVLSAIQTNREGSKVNKGRSKEGGHRLIDTEDVAETFGAIQTATNVLTLNRDPVSAANNVITWGIAKSRSGETGHAILTRSFYHMARTHWNDPKDSTWYRGSVSMADKVQELLENFSGSEVKNWQGE